MFLIIVCNYSSYSRTTRSLCWVALASTLSVLCRSALLCNETRFTFVVVVVEVGIALLVLLLLLLLPREVEEEVVFEDKAGNGGGVVVVVAAEFVWFDYKFEEFVMALSFSVWAFVIVAESPATPVVPADSGAGGGDDNVFVSFVVTPLSFLPDVFSFMFYPDEVDAVTDGLDDKVTFFINLVSEDGVILLTVLLLIPSTLTTALLLLLLLLLFDFVGELIVMAFRLPRSNC